MFTLKPKCPYYFWSLCTVCYNLWVLILHTLCSIGHHSNVLPNSTISIAASNSFFGLLGTMLSELLTG
nr:hypothetical protein CFP56_65009 [Quercus suber]